MEKQDWNEDIKIFFTEIPSGSTFIQTLSSEFLKKSVENGEIESIYFSQAVIKIPNSETYQEYLLENRIPTAAPTIV